jgi:hypothetical protein
MFYKADEIVELINIQTRDSLELVYYQLKKMKTEEEKKRYLISIKNKVIKSFDNRLNLARFE